MEAAGSSATSLHSVTNRPQLRPSSNLPCMTHGQTYVPFNKYGVLSKSEVYTECMHNMFYWLSFIREKTISMILFSAIPSSKST
jgi:hypothetical protein